MQTESFIHRSRIPAPAANVFAWHARPGALLRLLPPWDDVRVVDAGCGIVNASRTELDVPIGPFRHRWIAEHCDLVPDRQFRDVQVCGPFAIWDHVHRIVPDGADACWLEDRVEFAPPFGTVGRWLGTPLVRRKLRSMFAYRHRTTADDLRDRPPNGEPRFMNILVSGSTGLVGRALVPFLTTGGHSVTRLVRRSSPDQPGVRWDPVLGTIDQEGLEAHDAVVHLAGENIAGGRWSARRKKAIRDSRVHGTSVLCAALSRLRRPPKTLICASAIGIYGNRGDETLDETSPAGSGFLAQVCQEWEAAAEPARRRGIRVVHLRFGIVLSPAGGALASMLTPFKLGAGGVIGSGRQYWSWIEIDDVIGAIRHVLETESLQGAVNAVAPDPPTNREFTKTLGRVLGRPTVVPLPAFAARLVLGQMADELLLASARVVPRRLTETGYAFRFPALEPALRHLLGKA